MILRYDNFAVLLSELEGLESLSTSDPGRASEGLSKLVDGILESGRILPPRVSMVSGCVLPRHCQHSDPQKSAKCTIK